MNDLAPPPSHPVVVPAVYIENLNVISANNAVAAIGGSSVKDVGVTSMSEDKKPALTEPSANVRAQDQSSVSDVRVAHGDAQVLASNQSSVAGVSVGETRKEPWWRWYVEKLLFPFIITIAAAWIVWHFGWKK